MANVGFIGLGIMGGPMALNLQKGGHQLFLYSRSGVEPSVPLRPRSQRRPNSSSRCSQTHLTSNWSFSGRKVSRLDSLRIRYAPAAALRAQEMRAGEPAQA